MRALELTIPPPVVMLTVGLIMWLLAFVFPALTLPVIKNMAVAIIIGLVGLAISMAGVITFKRARTTSDPRHPDLASALVTSGVYRLTRNPMYLGVLLILIGWGVFLGNVLALACAFIFVPYINRYQIQPEERLLRDKFGEAFSAYTARVRRWL
ncbi:MAG: isoprenylcysteine carboxylmethyltransferase family protein [Burkholderiaceae bacterium]|nr:isoprenylcysteine carboxylmethyltransferase family protein [Burkholderiaceae bacterium]